MNNTNNLDPKLWGPPSWSFLVSVIWGYPSYPSYQDQLNYRQFLIYLQYVLPCESCRRNYSRHLLEMPLDNYLASRYHLLYWLTSLYNHSKPQQAPLSIQQFVHKYLPSQSK